MNIHKALEKLYESNIDNKTWFAIRDYIKDRSCENCKHSALFSECNFYICNRFGKLFNVDDNFGCNHWEQKTRGKND